MSNPMYYELNFAKRKVSFAILPIDLLAGRNVPADAQDRAKLRVSAEGILSPPILKRDGHIVFVDVSEGIYELKISSEHFHAENHTLRISHGPDADNGGPPIVKIGLTPKRGYPIDKGTPLLCANISPHIDAFLWQSGDMGIKLLSCYEEGGAGYIKVFESYNINMENKRFLLQSGGEGNTCDIECFFVDEKAGHGLYRLDKKLKKDWGKGTGIAPISCGRSDEDGYLFMPLRGIRDNGGELLLRLKDREGKIKDRHCAVAGPGQIKIMD